MTSRNNLHHNKFANPNLPPSVLMQANMQAQQEQNARVRVDHVLTDLAARIYAGLVVGMWGETQKNLTATQYRLLAISAREAVPFFGEAMGMLVIQPREEDKVDKRAEKPVAEDTEEDKDSFLLES